MKSFDKIIQYNDPKLGSILRQKTKDVKEIDNDIRSMLKDLKKLATSNSKEGITLVGLSAPQIGADVSVYIFLDLKTRKFIEVVNPKLIYSSKELHTDWEGCASIGSGPTSLFAPVSRSKSCQIQYLDGDGKEYIYSANAEQSHIILHEMDHLNGVLFLDRLKDPKMIFTAKELDDYARTHSGRYPKI